MRGKILSKRRYIGLQCVRKTYRGWNVPIERKLLQLPLDWSFTSTMCSLKWGRSHQYCPLPKKWGGLTPASPFPTPMLDVSPITVDVSPHVSFTDALYVSSLRSIFTSHNLLSEFDVACVCNLSKRRYVGLQCFHETYRGRNVQWAKHPGAKR